MKNIQAILLLSLLSWTVPVHVVRGQAIDFDGVDDYINVNASAVQSSLPFTFTIWVNTVDIGVNGAMTQGNTGNGTKLGIEVVSTFGAIRYQDATTSYFTSGTIAVNDGLWHHLAIVFAAANDRRLYVDGALDVSSTDNLALPVCDDIAIGIQLDSTPSNHFDGMLSDARIYNRALAVAEIETIADCRIGRGNPIASGLVCYLPLDDLTPGTGDLASAVIVDRSGNANNGTGSDANASANQGVAGFLTGP